MRKTNKKCLKSSGKRRGVLLLTILFITAMALIFITTALTITIATRKRIYENAKADQARLTVTSISQAIWQAIYSQQINDNMLYNLAYGTGGQGTLVQFDSSTIPGMGQPGSSTTAYFWIIQEANESRKTKRKIGIECKCEIDGIAQYYTMVLQQNKSEGKPAGDFNLQVELGNGGVFEHVVMGFDVSSMGSGFKDQIPYDSTDNIAVLHNPTWSGAGNHGLYSTMIMLDGVIELQDVVFGRDVYFVGSSGGMNFESGQNLAPSRVSDYGDWYFWGTTSPIYRNGSPAGGTTDFQINGVHDIYFDRMRYNASAYDPTRPIGEDNNPYPSSQFDSSDVVTPDVVTGFEDYTETFSSQVLGNITGSVYYDYEITGITDDSSGKTFTSQGSATSPWEPCADNGIGQYLFVNPGRLDTIEEVEEQFASRPDPTLELPESGTVTAGSYKVSSSKTFTSDMVFDVTGGPIYIYVDEDISIKCLFKIKSNDEGQKVNNDLTIIIANGKMINIYDNGGIVDTRCFSGSYSMGNIIQTTTPRCCIYSLSTNSDCHEPLFFAGNNNRILTAYVGFFCSDSNGDKIGNDGGAPYFGGNNMNNTSFMYGRLSAGGIDRHSTGDYLFMPYCPSYPSVENNRGYAYRDNTDYSVVGEESGYFTI